MHEVKFAHPRLSLAFSIAIDSQPCAEIGLADGSLW